MCRPDEAVAQGAPNLSMIDRRLRSPIQAALSFAVHITMVTGLKSIAGFSSLVVLSR
jgi:hypothetical protein